MLKVRVKHGRHSKGKLTTRVHAKDCNVSEPTGHSKNITYDYNMLKAGVVERCYTA